MTTEEILSILEKQFSGWVRYGDRGIITYLNIAQRTLLNIAADQLMIIDESTGKLPSFDTVDGVFAYDLASNVNFIDAVLVESGVNTLLLTGIFQQDYGYSSRIQQRPSESINISGISYIRIPQIRSYPATESASAKVVFTENPGDTSDIYRYRGYKLPTEITSDTIPLTIQPPYDTIYLLPATAKLLEGVQSGNYVDAYVFIQNELVPKLHNALNIGEFGRDYYAEDRGF